MCTNQIDVRTTRLWLRAPRDGDAERLHALLANWAVIRWLSAPPWPYTLAHAREWIAARDAASTGLIPAAITLDGGLIGVITAIRKPQSAIQREAGYNLGYWIGEPFWGRGYMSEAAHGFLAHVFATISDDVIHSGALKDNAASLRIQEKLGFARWGEGMGFSNPHQKDVWHTNTVLTRASFARCANAA
jgi:ribosomal-protein-alanine N-acetyltransferase